MPHSPPLELDQIVVAAGLALTGVVFLTGTADPVNIPKLAVLLMTGLAALALWLIRAARTRLVTVATGLPFIAAAAFAVALVVSTIVAPQLQTALIGATGRNSGLWAYLAALILYLSVLQAFTPSATKVLAFALLLAGGFTAIYGALQLLHIDAIAWNNPFSPMIATLGNPDFASAYLGITIPVALWGAWWTGWHGVLRALSGATAGLCLIDAVLSAAVQGPIAAASGATVFAIALTLDLSDRRRQIGLSAIGTVTLLGLAALVSGAAGAGPARPIFTRISFRDRTWYWEAALRMWKRSPFTGIGFDSYGLYWRRDRPLANPRTVGGDAYSDSAHSVPLQHLAQGGLLLAAAYVCFLVVVMIALLRGFRRLRGQERLLLAGIGGSWVAYQVQSLVSIDQVPLLVLNFVLGGGVLVASGSVKLRVIRLPGALSAAPPGGRGRQLRAPRSRPWGPADVSLIAVITLGTLIAMWLSLSPLRANLAAHQGDLALSAGDGTAAILHFQKAVELQPGFGPYRTRIGDTYNRGSLPAQARTAFAAAFHVDKAEINAGRAAARLAETAGDYAQARSLFAQALELDPTNSATILDWAGFQLRHGSAAAVQKRLDRAVRDLPAEAGLWATLGDARRVLGDSSGARSAYERALQLKPGEPTATAGLQQLASR